MRNRLYIVSWIVIVMQTMAVLYSSISAKDYTTAHLKRQDSISQQLDTLLPAYDSLSARLDPIKKKSIKSSQKSIKQEIKTERVIDIRLELSVNNDSIDLCAQDTLDSCQDSRDSILAKQDAQPCDAMNNGREDSYKEKSVPQVLSEWTFPLIIMLFAFGFPFIFSVITRIEEKYHSEEISSSITQTSTYKLYEWSLYISLGCSFLFSVILLCGPISVAFEYTWIIIVGIISIWLVVMTFLLVHKLFTYNDPAKLYKANKKEDKSLECSKSKTFAIYYYALQHDMKNLLEIVESTISKQVNTYRSNFKDRNQVINYPQVVIEDLIALYEKVLKTNNQSNQERVSRLLCVVLFNHDISNNYLQILGNDTLSNLWKIFKLTIQSKADSSFAIIWNYLVDYYNKVSAQPHLQNRKEELLDLIFVISSYCYYEREYANIELILTCEVGSHGYDDIKLNHIEDVLYRYYRATNDFMFAKTPNPDLYKHYVIIDKNVEKTQQINPITQYTSFLIHRIFNQGRYYLQFNPFALLERFFGYLPKAFRPTSNLREMLSRQKSIESTSEIEVNVKDLMTKEDIDAFYQNTATITKIREKERLLSTPISVYWEKEFRERFKNEEHQINFNIKNIFAPKEVNAKDSYSYDSTFFKEDYVTTFSEPYTQDTNQIEETDEWAFIKLFSKDSFVKCPKANFVYSTYKQADDDVYATAKKLAIEIHRQMINRHAEAFLSMKEYFAKTISSGSDFVDMIDSKLSEKDIIVYFALKTESKTRIDIFGKGSLFTYQRDKVYYKNHRVYIINGEDLEPQLYKSLKQSFVVYDRNDLMALYNNKLWDYETFEPIIEDFNTPDCAMLKVRANADISLYYKKKAYKLLRYKKSASKNN